MQATLLPIIGLLRTGALLPTLLPSSGLFISCLSRNGATLATARMNGGAVGYRGFNPALKGLYSFRPRRFFFIPLRVYPSQKQSRRKSNSYHSNILSFAWFYPSTKDSQDVGRFSQEFGKFSQGGEND